MNQGLLFPLFVAFSLMLVVHDSAAAQNTGKGPEGSVATSLTYPIAQIYQVHIGYKPGKIISISLVRPIKIIKAAALLRMLRP